MRRKPERWPIPSPISIGLFVVIVGGLGAFAKAVVEIHEGWRLGEEAASGYVERHASKVASRVVADSLNSLREREREEGGRHHARP